MLRKTALPAATHYVGYVEDDETPEMIMKKFEELERIKAAAGAGGGKRSALSVAAAAGAAGGAAAAVAAGSGQPMPASSVGPSSCSAGAAAAQGCDDAADSDGWGDGGLDEAQLAELFKATSMYNVKSLLGNNEALMVDALPTRLQQGDRGAAADLGLDSGAGCCRRRCGTRWCRVCRARGRCIPRLADATT